ncbi:MAG: hypothetical protein NTY76_06190 [Candidatus Omnitrophica bacterium]|nr:hypothetical protein [Candidatus Omnitrophota bacterium]
MVEELLYIVKFIIGFLPWILLLILPTNSWGQLQRAVAICLVISVIFAWKELRKGFILQWASVLFFLFCTISFYGFKWVWLAYHMAIISNGFLTGVIFFTVLIGKPFTLQYARAELPKEQWYNEDMIRGCQFIAIFWGVLLSIPTAFNVFRLFYPVALPGYVYSYLSPLCIIIGVSYTTFYKRQKRKERSAASHS